MSLLEEFREWPDFVHQTDPQGFRAGDLLRTQDHVQGLIASDAASQARAAAPRGYAAEVEFRKSDLGALGCSQAKMTRQREFESPAEAVSVENGNCRLRKILDGMEDA